ncbi:putative Zinc knuckle-containing protein 10, partial [Homarus americanus]
MGNGIILNIISKYGKVEGMRLNKYTKGPAAGLLNGTRTFKVNLKNNIPSSVTVGGHSLTFLFAGQRKTCYKCGHEGHLAIDCHTEEVDKRNNVDQTKGKISCKNVEYDKADDMEATNMTGTECEVARDENMDRMEEIVEATCNMSPSINRYDANKKEQNKLVKNELEINGNDENQNCTKQNKNNENQSNLSGQVNSQTGNGLECGKGRKDDGKKLEPIGKDDSRWEKVEHVQSWKVRAVSGSKVMLSKRDGKEIAKKEENKGDNSTDEEEKRGVKRN